jgi:uncharacterized protein
MMIFVKVIPRASHAMIERLSDTEYRVRLTKVPADGEANRQLIRMLADYFDTAPSLIHIAKGASSRQKLVEIPDDSASL